MADSGFEYGFVGHGNTNSRRLSPRTLWYGTWTLDSLLAGSYTP